MQTNKILATTLATFMAMSTFAQTVDEIVDKHVAALGGADKLASVKTLIIERSMAINGMQIPVKATMLVGKAVRSDMSIMGNSMVQVVDGTTGWMIRPAQMGGTGDPEDMPADMIKQQTGQLDPFGALVNYKAKESKVELVGKEKVDGKDAYHLKVTTKGGNVVDEYVDASTYLVSKVTQSMGGQTSEINFSDYKATDGVQFAQTMEIVGGQMGTLTFSTDKVKVNPPVDESIFKKGAK